MLKLDKVGIWRTFLLLCAAEGDLVPIVLISHRHAADGNSQRWRMNPDKLPRITAKRKSNISIRQKDGWYQYIVAHRDRPTIWLRTLCMSTVFVCKWCGVGDAHLSSCISPLPFPQVHFIFISARLERVNSIPSRLWLRLGTFTVSLSLALFRLLLPLALSFALFSLCLCFQSLITFREWLYSGYK